MTAMVPAVCGPETISAGELGCALGIAERSARRRLSSEGVPTVQARSTSGQTQNRYLVNGLPEEDRHAVMMWRHRRSAEVVPRGQSLPEICRERPPAMCEVQEKKALAKADLLRLYLGALERASWGKKKDARDAFVEAYNTGIAYPVLFAALGPKRWQTIEGWKRAINQRQHVSALADRRGVHRRGIRAVSDAHGLVLLRIALNPSRTKLAKVIRRAKEVMAETGMPTGYSDATFRRWLNDWKVRNFDVWVFYRQGYKAWNDKVAYYLERNYDLLSVGDVLVADGHKLNFETINPFTGKAKRMTLILWYDMKSNFPLGWEVMPTENTQAIASAFRRAVIRLGKYPRVVYLDNGKAFRARFFQGCPNFDEAGFAGIYGNMGIATCFAWPYHGQSKTVERFFGTMAELERDLISYSGTSIETKPPRMMRGEKLHRAVHEKLCGGRALTMEETHMALASWFDEYVQRPQGPNSHLAGQRPIDVFVPGSGEGVNREELRQMMMSEMIRTVYRNGIRFPGVGHYFHDDLKSIRHPVLIRYDLQDKSEIYVYDQYNNFICIAEPVVPVHPMYKLGTQEDREAVADGIAIKKRQRKEVEASARRFLEDEMLPEHRRMMADLGVNVDPALLEAPAEPPKEPKKLPQKEYRRLELVAEKARAEMDAEAAGAKMAKRPEIFVSDRERYDWAWRSVYQHGLEIPADDRSWMGWFESTEEFEKYRNYYEERRQFYDKAAVNA